MSGAEDMAKWVMVQLDSGRTADGTRLFSPASTTQIWREVTPTPINDAARRAAAPAAQVERLRPGPGVRDYRGAGCSSPYRRAARLRLAGGDDPRAPARRRGADQPGVRRSRSTPSPTGCSTTISARRRRTIVGDLSATDGREPGTAGRGGAHGPRRSRDSTSGPSLPLEKYAGTYRDDWYGDVAIAPGRRRPGHPLHHAHRPWWATWCTGSTTPSSRGGATASCAPTPTSTFALNPGRIYRPGEDGADVAAGGLQLRLPGPAVAARPEG